jgi:hypothetical protein
MALRETRWHHRAAPVLFASAFVLGATIIGGTTTAGASTGATTVKLPANFAWIGTIAQGRCNATRGVEFPTVPGAIEYTVSYWDGLYKVLKSG